MVFVRANRDGLGAAVYNDEVSNGTDETVFAHEEDRFSTCDFREVEDANVRVGKEPGYFIPATSPITGGASVLKAYNRPSPLSSSTVERKLDTRPRNHLSIEGGKMQVLLSPTLSRSNKDDIAELDLQRQNAEVPCMGAPLVLSPFSHLLLPGDTDSFEAGGLDDDHPFSVKQQFRMSTEFAPLWRSYCRDGGEEMADDCAEEEEVGLRDDEDGSVFEEGASGDEGLLDGDGEVRLGKGERDGGSDATFFGCFCWPFWIGGLGRVLEDWG